MSNHEDDTSDGAEVVDFDALNAALGAIPSAPSSSPMIAASEGRSAATYSSVRPHRIPSSYAPADDLNTPAVIVEAETVPSGPPVQMTMPMGDAGVTAPHATMPHDMGRAHGAASPGHAFTPPPFSPSGAPVDPSATMPMPALRRPRNPTLVIPPIREPSRARKLAVFMSMLLVFVASGIAFLILYKPSGISIDLRALTTNAPPPPTVTAPPPLTVSPSVVPVVSVTPAVSVAAPSVSVSSSASAALSAAPISPSALPSASATVPKKPKPRPTAAPPPPPPTATF